MGKLRKHLDFSTGTGDADLDAALEVLRPKKKEEDADEDKMNIDEGGDQNAALDRAIDILLENAIDEFGFAPRDVYSGIFKLMDRKLDHEKALETLDFLTLQNLVRGFIGKTALHGASNKVVAVYPKLKSPSLGRESWVIDLKSIRIREHAKYLLPMAEFQHLRNMFALFRKGVISASFAGWIFEEFVHRNFLDGWKFPPEPIPTLIPMFSDNNPCTFKEGAPSSTGTTRAHLKRSTRTDATPSIPPTPMLPGTRTRKPVTFTESGDDYIKKVTLDLDTYYVPTDPINPLFDSFTIGCHETKTKTSEQTKKFYTIYLLQATVSEKHGGSPKGYPIVRQIVDRVERLFDTANSGAQIEVAYCLVCPNDNSANTWSMPTGWDEDPVHQQNVYCLRILI